MKALSIKPFYSMLIALGEKWIELRSWKTDYRGWILICSSRAANKFERVSMVSGKAIAIAYLGDVRPYEDSTDRDLAYLYDDETFSGYAWVLDRIIPIEPIPIKGQLRLFNADVEIDDLLPVPIDFESENSRQDLFNWWLENQHIDNLDFLNERAE